MSESESREKIDIDAYIEAWGIPEYWESPEGQRAKRMMESKNRNESAGDFLKAELELAERNGSLTSDEIHTLSASIALINVMTILADSIDKDGEE